LKEYFLLDYFDRVQESIEFIENHITEEMELEDIAKRAYCSLFHFHRIFQALVGDSIKEYIRKRRLSLAGRELAISNVKVIDTALKYRYETPEAFTKAFKKFHGTSPLLCRKSGSFKFREKAFVHIFQSKLLEGGLTMNYKIVEKDSFKIIGRELRIRNDNGDNFKLIPGFWDQCKNEGVWEELMKLPRVLINDEGACLGMCMDFDGINTFSYLICVEVSNIDFVPEKMVAKTIPAQKYAVFTAKGKMAESIQQTWKDIYQEWFPSSGYERTSGPDFELYDKRSEANDENTEVDIYIPIK
jgi:AraC family transcriptional regulator